MFYYFGYGSNLSVVSLRAKGVDPLTSEPAVLPGWRLAFDIPDFFAIEGGTGNIQPSDDDAVHGVLHGCRSRHLAVLDQLEAVGSRYRRVETTVLTYAGRAVRAYVYLGLESVLDPTLRPSERYRNILVKGAVDMNLDSRYVDRLRAIETCPRVDHGPFRPPPSATEVFDLDRLRSSDACTALGGWVFDMTKARAEHQYLRSLIGGRDATILFLKRMDSSTGAERMEDVVAGRLTPEQASFLESYLHEFAREYQCVGKLEYTSSERAGAAADARRKSLTATGSWRPVFSTEPSGAIVSSRAVVQKGEDARAELGHENLGFLSAAKGFMPVEHPRLSMPSGYEAWDQIAAELPELHLTLKLRRAVDALPILPADADHLPDDALLRAALVLGMLSHAYRYVETMPPEKQPDALAKPWEVVRARLGRGPAVITYQDLIVYNWRLLDPRRADAMALDNMRLLVPTVDNDEERTFYLTQTQILAHASPIVNAIVRAQEGVVTEDPETVESALMTIIACLQRIVRESLLHINPSPDSPTYVDPVVWAKTVAPFAVPMQEGIQGPSGTSSPIFNLLDVFFGRKRYETFLGREIVQLRSTYPPLWRELIAAVQEISVPDYVENRGKAHLSGLLHEARSIYAGPNGFLGRHRMKVYGYIELAFKVGRSITIGGFKGVFKDRTWDQVDAELERSRVERAQSFPQSCYQARVKAVIPDRPLEHGGVFDVVLDVSGTGLRYEVGDRCGILPESCPDLVEKTLKAFGATGEEPIRLSDEWREAVRLRAGYENVAELPLAELCRFGQLRPMHPRVAEALHAITQNEILGRAIREGKTHHWELWDALEMLRASGFDPARLFAEGNDPDRRSPICEIVPPETFRMYSISSVVSSAETESASEIRLTVGPLSYVGRDGHERRGVASTFLATLTGRKEPIPITIQHPPRFSLPRDGKVPIVMIAGGTGVAPFRAFLAERKRQLAPSKAYLFLGVRSRADLIHEIELQEDLAQGRLELEVAFSREEARVRWDPNARALVFEPGKKRYVDELLLDEANGRAIWDVLRPVEEGGRGGHVYVCGRTRFAKAAIDSLKRIFARFAPVPEAERDEYATRMLRELAAEGRFMQEVFSGEAAAEDLEPIDVSEIVKHNDDQNGYWVVIEGRVYDLTEYVRLHPGGMRILAGYAGMDATDGYARAHHARTEIDATREMYVIGVVRTLDLRGPTATVIGPAGPQVVSLSGAYRAWMRTLYLAVEMQNALRNDQALQNGVTTRGELPTQRSLYKLQRAVETHERFLRSYVDGLANESFPSLWAITRGMFAPSAADDWMAARIATVRASPAAEFVEGIAVALHAAIDELIARNAPEDDPARLRIVRACEILEHGAAQFLADTKMLLREGLRVFEEHGKDAIARGDALVAACRRLPELLVRYHGSLHLRLTTVEGWKPVRRADGSPYSSGRTPAFTQRILFCSKYWYVEEHVGDRVMIFRRTSIPFESLDILVRENTEVLTKIREEHATFGIVVDMRQAPPRNDPGFEGAMRTLRETLTQRFARLAVLVESSAGVLQVNRLGRDQNARHFATMSEVAAIKFAKGET